MGFKVVWQGIYASPPAVHSLSSFEGVQMSFVTQHNTEQLFCCRSDSENTQIIKYNWEFSDATVFEIKPLRKTSI